jgi:hypothetical protein
MADKASKPMQAADRILERKALAIETLEKETGPDYTLKILHPCQQGPKTQMSAACTLA